MIGQSLVDAFGKGLNKSFGSLPGSTGKGAGVFATVAGDAGNRSISSLHRRIL